MKIIRRDIIWIENKGYIKGNTKVLITEQESREVVEIRINKIETQLSYLEFTRMRNEIQNPVCNIRHTTLSWTHRT